MIPVKRITIERAEGPSDLCVEKTFPTWEEATHWMFSQSHTFPKTGGYDKHDVKVEWQDGTVIGCRLDATGGSDHELDVAGRIWSCVSYYSGKRIPLHLTEEKFQACLKRYPQEWKDLCKKVAETCDISFYNGSKVR